MDMIFGSLESSQRALSTGIQRVSLPLVLQAQIGTEIPTLKIPPHTLPSNTQSVFIVST
jgi:hypothetical protein